MKQLLADFRAFLMRGNLIELAVAFVIGTAFALVLKAFVSDLIMPIVAAIVGKPNFDDLTFTINGSVFAYGSFLTAVITFVFTAAAVFFFVVKPYELFQARKPKDPTEKPCPECTISIPVAAKRCPQCTAIIA